MSRLNTICLKCGLVQVRTDIDAVLQGTNITMIKHNCPSCKIITPHVLTKDVKVLKKQLNNNPSNNIDGRLYNLLNK